MLVGGTAHVPGALPTGSIIREVNTSRRTALGGPTGPAGVTR